MSNVLGIIPPDMRVEIIGKDPGENWWQILYPQGADPEGKGWVTAQYITTVTKPEVPTIGGGDGADPNNDNLAIIQQKINIRSGPGTGFNSIGTLNPQDAVNLTGKDTNGTVEGGIEGRPANVLLYATSNRRHLMPRQMIDNERSTAIHPGEAVEEKVSLSDRFGLWLGFHPCGQDIYLAMVQRYAAHFQLAIETEELRREALEWAKTRGSRSGRVAWQLIQDVAGRLGSPLQITPSG